MFPDVITPNYIISQAIGVIVIISVAVGFFQKTKVRFFLTQIIANFFISLSFLFLGQYFVCIGVGIAFVRTIIFFLFEQKGKEVPYWLVGLIIAVTIANCVIFWSGPLNLLILLALILFTVGYKVKNIQFMRYFLLVPNLLYIIFDSFTYAYSDLIQKSLTIISIVSSIIYYHIKNKKIKNLEGTQSLIECEKTEEV